MVALSKNNQITSILIYFDPVTDVQPLKFASANVFIEHANILFFFQIKLFLSFVKLLKKIMTACLYRCSLRPQNAPGENITSKKLNQVVSFYLARNPFVFYRTHVL